MRSTSTRQRLKYRTNLISDIVLYLFSFHVALYISFDTTVSLLHLVQGAFFSFDRLSEQVSEVHKGERRPTPCNVLSSFPADMSVSCHFIRFSSPAARWVSRRSCCGDIRANSDTRS